MVRAAAKPVAAPNAVPPLHELVDAPIRELRSVYVVDWLPEELAAWDVPELIPSSVWVERHIRIPSRDAAVPGPINIDVTPYLRGPYAAIDDPQIDIITMICGTQIGKSTFQHTAMVALAVQRPGPMLFVLPTEPDAREVAGGTLKHLVEECGPLIDQAVGGREGLTKEGYQFAGCSWYFGWSNSAASLARRACRYVWYDEVEKFPPYVGRESDPIRLGDARLRTYRLTTGAKSIRVSSPTTPEGLIGQSWDRSDQRRFWVPCPECGTHQVLVWSQVGWPKSDDGHSMDPDEIVETDQAWYECAATGCDAHWSDPQRWAAVRQGVWARDGQTVDRSGRVRGEATKPRSRHAGFHISALYSSFVKLAPLAAEWLDIQHDIAGLQGFVNQELGEFWEEVETKVDEAPLRKHVGGYQQGQAPAGVQIVTAFVDVQHGWFVVEVRGWGFGLESWILEAHIIQTDQELHDFLRDRRYQRLGPDGGVVPPDALGGAPLAIRLSLIDSGDQTDYVYHLVQGWRDIDIRPSKGVDELRSGAKIRTSPILKSTRNRRAFAHKMLLYMYDTNFFKDSQARLAQVDKPGPGYLHLPDDIPEDWFKQFASERKVTDRKRGKAGRSGRAKKYWKPKYKNVPNHWWDCAVGNCVITDAQILNLRNLPDPKHPPRPRRRRVGRIPLRGR